MKAIIKYSLLALAVYFIGALASYTALLAFAYTPALFAYVDQADMN